MPRMPALGYGDAPAPTVLRPTFDDVATAIDAFIAQGTMRCESRHLRNTLAHSVARLEVALRAGDDLSVGGMIRTLDADDP
jgi:hypothetical protein